MNNDTATQLLLLLGIAWLVLAAALALFGIRRSSQATRVAGDARAIADLLAASPMAPMLVYPDGSVDADPRIAERLGLDRSPARIGDLAAGFVSADFARLDRTLLAAFDSGREIEERLLTIDGVRTMRLRGGPYAAIGIPERAMLVWLSDVTVFQKETDRLTGEVARLSGALEGLSVLIEAAPFPIWHRGPDLELALVNNAYVRAVEASDAGDVVARALELIEPGPEGSAVEIARVTRELGTVHARAAPAIIAGQRRMMRVVDVPIGSAGVAGFAMDVQELEDARADLARLGQAQRDMLDRLSSGVVQFGGDHALIFFNRHFQRMFALEPEWLADRPEFGNVLERMRESQHAPESRDFRVWKDERRGWFQSADPVEETWLLPTGIHLRVVAQPMPDGGLLLIFEDRTEHLQLASRHDTLLRVREATFDNLFEGVGVFAQDGRLQLWNTRFSEMWEIEETKLGAHPRIDAFAKIIAPMLVDPEGGKMVRDLVRVATIDRQQRRGRIALKDGRHFQVASVPLPDGNALFTLIDITASRGIEEALRDRNAALEDANTVKSVFVERMSTELRDPLNSITGYAEMLAGGYAGELKSTAHDYVQAIVSSVKRVSGLIGDALDLSQSEVGDLPLEAERVEIGVLVTEAVKLAGDPAHAAGLTLQVRIATEAGMVIGDHRRLAQSLDNLLRNAIAYTPAGGRVLIEARAGQGVAEISVADNGPGISPEDQVRIFDRLARSRPTDPGDLGLAERRGVGLPLARQLIEGHGGTLTLDSTLGQGTRVTIRLPLAPEGE